MTCRAPFEDAASSSTAPTTTRRHVSCLGNRATADVKHASGPLASTLPRPYNRAPSWRTGMWPGTVSMCPAPDAHRIASRIDKGLVVAPRPHDVNQIRTGHLFLGRGTRDTDQFPQQLDFLIHRTTSATWATTVSTSSWVIVRGGKKRNTVTPAARAMIPRSMRA